MTRTDAPPGSALYTSTRGFAMADVFLSYDSDDRVRIEPLVALLERNGFTVWWDRRIDMGASFDLEIEREIAEAACVVVVWSENSIQSEWVRNEVDDGLERGILVPVQIDDVRLPLAARRLQTAKIVGWPDVKDDRVLGQLIASIRSYADKAPPRSIAVLPFENMSPAKEDEYFAAAMHDQILTQLAKLSTLKVISRTSVMEYKDVSRNLREISRELDVATILEGSVEKVGNIVRINVQLIDAQTDEHRWAESFDRELTVEKLFAIQREIARTIADALRAKLTPSESSRLAEIPTRSTRAYNFYLMGNVYLEDPDLKSALPIAIDMYERAVKEDPSFAAAYARLCRAHGMFKFGGGFTADRRRKAVRALERAIELDEDSAEVHLARAVIERDSRRSLEHCELARSMMPGDPAPLLESAQRYWRLEQYEMCIAQLDRAIWLDPRNTLTLWRKAANYHPFLRQYELADAACERILEIEPTNSICYVFRHYWLALQRGHDLSTIKKSLAEGPGELEVDFLVRSAIALWDRDYDEVVRILDEQDWDSSPEVLRGDYHCEGTLYGLVYRLKGDDEAATTHFRRARDRIERRLEKNPTDHRYVIALGEALAGLGMRAEAVAEAFRALELDKNWFGGQLIRHDAIRRVLVPAGDLDSGIAELERYLSAPGDWSIEGLLPDPRLDPIREDPRFVALLERYRRD